MNRSHTFVGIVWIGIVGIIPLQGMATEPPVGTEKIAKEARETIEATKQYTAQQKELFQGKVHEELVAVQRQGIALWEGERSIRGDKDRTSEIHQRVGEEKGCSKEQAGRIKSCDRCEVECDEGGNELRARRTQEFVPESTVSSALELRDIACSFLIRSAFR